MTNLQTRILHELARIGVDGVSVTVTVTPADDYDRARLDDGHRAYAGGADRALAALRSCPEGADADELFARLAAGPGGDR